MRINFLLAALLSASFSATALDYKVTVYGKHEIDPSTDVKTALYRYRVDNIGGRYGACYLTIGDGATVEDPPLLDATRSNNVEDNCCTAPTGWSGRDVALEESNLYALEWRLIETDDDVKAHRQFCIPEGQSSDAFTARVTKADGMFVDYPAKVGGQFIPIIKHDQQAPTLQVYLHSAPARGRPGWLEVTANAQAQDNFDPHPAVRLTKISVNGKAVAKDVEAVFDEENKTFFVKAVPGRIYSVVYTAVDATNNQTSTVLSLPVK